MQATTVTTEVSKEEVESRLGISISDEAFERAYEHAKRKLARIIEREGDLDGARLQPFYITQLTVEAVREQGFSEFTILLCNAHREAEKIHREKRNARSRSHRANLNP